MKKINHIIIYIRKKQKKQNINQSLHNLIEYLKNNNIKYFLDYKITKIFKLKKANPDYKLIKKYDLIVVIGGDGSLLSAAQIAIQANIPIIGINQGNLGFLTDISPNNLKKNLNSIFSGNYQEEIRSLLHLSIYNGKKIYYQKDALNDIVLSKGIKTYLIEFDIYINKYFVNHYCSDGIILATPTGSTAYSLSAGGPIVHPKLHAIILTPISSHNLNSRPLIIDQKSKINIKINKRNKNTIFISCDGQKYTLIKPGQYISIKNSNKKLRILHPNNYQYYKSLKIKLGWGYKNKKINYS
ncbi:NAD(+) kinase [Candidatus Legionella polyplacis]|uniref:NAD kinase n=1 Tax=Candidatus Legionella polyplacis TaxID=2005262 RepID=A0ABZ2GWZ8_9GAMM